MKTCIAKLLIAASVGAFTLAQAQGSVTSVFPSNPIRIIVPLNPGGSTDILGRSTGQELTKAWGEPIVVDNFPGAISSVRDDMAAKAPADSYTLLNRHIGTLAVSSSYPRLPYDPVKSFTPEAWVACVPDALVVSSPQRMAAQAALPDLPTVAEPAYKSFKTDQWYGVVAPANTPHQLVLQLNAQINRSLDSVDLKSRLTNKSAIATSPTPEAFGQLIMREIARWNPVI